MTPEQQERLNACLQEAASILYEDTPEEMHHLEDIEQVVRQHWLKQIGPQLGVFLSAKLRKPSKAEPGH